MDEAFRHLHMPAELAIEFLAVFSRMEYALKASRYATGNENKVYASWDGFANDVDEAFRQIANEEFTRAVEYLLTCPPRKQVLEDGVLRFRENEIDRRCPLVMALCVPEQRATNLASRLRNQATH